jgi:hypothetical protein
VFALALCLITQELSSHEFLTPEEAGELVGISPSALEKHRLHGTGPRYYKMGPGPTAKILYRRQDLLAWRETSSEQ